MSYHDPIEPDQEVLDDIKKHFRYDCVTGKIERLDKRNGGWRELKVRNRKGSDRGPQPIQIRVKGKCTSIYPHHICWFLHYESWPTHQIDHIKKNCTDNKITNLDIVSGRLNSINRDTKYGLLPGVVRGDNKINPYKARIRISGTKKHLGVFPTEILAHEAYRRAYKELEGVELNWPYLPWHKPIVTETPLEDLTPEERLAFFK